MKDMHQAVRLSHVYEAKKNIASSICRTPLKHSESLSTEHHHVYLKLESQQITGSFKFRGASNAIAKLVAAKGDNINGVVGVSTGNHGKGLALAAKKAGIHSNICMSELVPSNKVEGIKRFGADVKIIGKSQDDAQVEADRLVKEEHKVMLPPFDHHDVIAGQGTIALEIIEALPNVDNVIVPVSGGGLIFRCGDGN
jgi:L-threonine ammonia-lyase (EC 4.3.1.19)